jgi:hypothetical protein
VAGKRVPEALPPFGERGIRILIQRYHATFSALCLASSYDEKVL